MEHKSNRHLHVGLRSENHPFARGIMAQIGLQETIYSSPARPESYPAIDNRKAELFTAMQHVNESVVVAKTNEIPRTTTTQVAGDVLQIPANNAMDSNGVVVGELTMSNGEVIAPTETLLAPEVAPYWSKKATRLAKSVTEQSDFGLAA